jgi:membrane associated rhomboid family serine protease
MLAGGVLGFIGGWLVAPGMDNIANQPVIAFAGALSGAAIGMLIGSLLGLRLDDDKP